MDEETLNQIGEMAETLDNSLFMAKNNPNMSLQIHLNGLIGTMEKVRDALIELYEENGGAEELDIQA